jgi:hypothetical protein
LPLLHSLHSPHSGLLSCFVSCRNHGKEAFGLLFVLSYVLEGDDIIANFDTRHSRTDALNDTGSFVAEHDGESALGILSTESIGICVTKSIVVNSNSHLVGSGRTDLDFLNAQVLASGPGNGGFAGDGLAASLSRIVHHR